MKRLIKDLAAQGMPLEACDKCNGSGLILPPGPAVSTWQHGNYACDSCKGLGYYPGGDQLKEFTVRGLIFAYGLIFEIHVDENKIAEHDSLEHAIEAVRRYKFQPGRDCCIYIDVLFLLDTGDRVPGPTLYTYENHTFSRSEISV